MKRTKQVLALLLAVALCLSLCACGAPKTYVVHFNGNGGELVSGKLEQTVTVGTAPIAPVFEREGYVFSDWDTDLSSISQDTTVYAIWTKAVTYLISFDTAGGTVISGKTEQQVAEGKKPAAPTLSREGYSFKGWDGELSPATEDTVYTAQWEGMTLKAGEVYNRIAPSMVEITIYDRRGNATSLGSGFFIDSKGTLVTNYHVIEDAYTATATLYNEEVCNVTGLLGYDEDLDLAILSTDLEASIPVILSQRSVSHGDTIYTLGSSLGETDTFSTGIVSNPSRIYDDEEFIQIDAAISPGNSGGPLINEYGEVIGINSWQYTSGQNMNYAIKVTELDRVDTSTPITMEEFRTAFGAPASAPTSTGSSGSIQDDEHCTIVSIGDEGEWVYETADYIEWEDNNKASMADKLVNGCLTAGYVDEDDLDLFSIKLTQRTEVSLMLWTYWSDDDEYIRSALVDAGLNVIKDTSGNSAILEYDEDDQTWYLTATLNAGTYYLAVFLKDGYPYDNGAFYLVEAAW